MFVLVVLLLLHTQVAFAGEGVRVLRYETLRRDWASWSMEMLGREVPLPYSNSSAPSGKAGHYSEEYAGDQVRGAQERSGILERNDGSLER